MRGSLVLLLAGLGCTTGSRDLGGTASASASTTPPATPAPTGAWTASGQPEAGLRAIVTDELELWWEAQDDWTLEVVALADVNDDGHTDALIDLDATWQHHALLLVHGPLSRALALPGDEAAGFGPATLQAIGDVDGDGATELIVWPDDADDAAVVPGTITGVVDPADHPTAPGRGWYLDADGDGVLDRAVPNGQGVLEVSLGPYAHQATVPDWQVPGACPTVDRYPYQDQGTVWVGALPDLRGTGTQELFVGNELCLDWIMDLFAGPDEVVRGDLRSVTPVGDQDGDGIEDVLVDSPREILLGPLEWTEDAVLGAGSWPLGMIQPIPLPYDVTGDGIQDFLDGRQVSPGEVAPPPAGRDDIDDDDAWVIVPGGPDVDQQSTFELAIYKIRGNMTDHVFQAGGRAWTLLELDGGYGLIELADHRRWR